MVFDREGRFLRAWGEGMFQTTHFLRVTRGGRVWVTDRGGMQAFEFDSGGKLLLTVGRKGVLGDNNSTDAFNGMADLAVAKNGDFFIADGEGRRILKSGSCRFLGNGAMLVGGFNITGRRASLGAFEACTKSPLPENRGEGCCSRNVF